MSDALAFVAQMREQPNAVQIEPGRRHRSIFTELYQPAGVKGNLVPDACLAALAIQSGSTWIPPIVIIVVFLG